MLGHLRRFGQVLTVAACAAMTPNIHNLKSVAASAGGLFGAAAVDAPPAVLAVALVGLVLWFAWRVFSGPTLLASGWTSAATSSGDTE